MAMVEVASARTLESRTETSAAELLVLVGRRATALYAEGLKPIGLKPRHVRTLHALRNGPLSQQSLSDEVGVDGTQLVGFLNELESERLVQRRRHPEDRRRHIVELSQRGRTRLQAALEAIAAVDTKFMLCLPPEQRAAFVAQLQTIARQLGTSCEEIARECDAGPSPDACTE
jgi:MarR family transcriptional regulator, lower aerobic nicotinate degradation pathway regulator